ncbi:hypothetical protein MHYP_G00136190 [Metynnis hypsauchen]
MSMREKRMNFNVPPFSSPLLARCLGRSQSSRPQAADVEGSERETIQWRRESSDQAHRLKDSLLPEDNSPYTSL